MQEWYHCSIFAVRAYPKTRVSGEETEDAMFELVQLRCFVAVAEELHFGRAAARLNMSQPPLSRHIQVLERIIGVQLFNRSSRSVRLTAGGTAFLDEARRVVGMADNALLTARAAAQGETGVIKLGFTAASAYSLVPQLIEKAAIELPEIRLILREMVTSEQIDGLAGGNLDLALLRPPARQPDLHWKRVLTERLVVCSPASVPLHERPKRLEDFDGKPLVMYAPDKARYFYDLLTGLFASAGANPDYVQNLAQIHSIMILVAARHGFGIVPESATLLRPAGVEFAPLADVGEVAELYAAWRMDHQNPAVCSFMERVGLCNLSSFGKSSPANTSLILQD